MGKGTPVTSEMVASGRVVLDEWISFWEIGESDQRRDELVQKIFLAMRRRKKTRTQAE